MILFLLIGFFVLVTTNVVHELMHQYNPSEIDQICFFGFERDGSILNSAIGWVKADSYWNYGETIPVIVSIIYLIITTTSLFIIFRED